MSMDHGLGGGFGGGSALAAAGYGAPMAQPTSIGGHVLPESHEEQVQLGFRMIQNSFTTKVAQMENELVSLKQNVEEQKSQAATLQRKNSALEVELVESHQRASGLTEENRELFKQVHNLRRQLARLEGLKKKVLSSITDEDDDDPLHGQSALGYGGVAEPITGSAAFPATRAASPPRLHAYAASAGATGPEASFSGAGAGMVDGKQFFRQARSQLSNEAFTEFLTNIKKLNAASQSREQTLEEARRIFGPELHHLYKEFEQLLNRHAV